MLEQLSAEDFIYATPKGHTFKHQPTSSEVIKTIKRQSDKVLLSFSTGKDSIIAWLAIRDHFEVHPFYLYVIPDLEFIDDTLAYYEKFFNAKIPRYPNVTAISMLNSELFQPPHRRSIISSMGLPESTFDEIRQEACEDFKIPLDTWYASGVRASDSLNRRASFRVHGPFTNTKKCFYPVWDVRKCGLAKMIELSRVKLPIDYWLFGKSFDGLDFRFLYPIKKYFPRDYQKILELYPLAELEIWRYEKYGKK